MCVTFNQHRGENTKRIRKDIGMSRKELLRRKEIGWSEWGLKESRAWEETKNG